MSRWAEGEAALSGGGSDTPPLFDFTKTEQSRSAARSTSLQPHLPASSTSSQLRNSFDFAYSQGLSSELGVFDMRSPLSILPQLAFSSRALARTRFCRSGDFLRHHFLPSVSVSSHSDNEESALKSQTTPRRLYRLMSNNDKLNGGGRDGQRKAQQDR